MPNARRLSLLATVHYRTSSISQATSQHLRVIHARVLPLKHLAIYIKHTDSRPTAFTRMPLDHLPTRYYRLTEKRYKVSSGSCRANVEAVAKTQTCTLCWPRSAPKCSHGIVPSLMELCPPISHQKDRPGNLRPAQPVKKPFLSPPSRWEISNSIEWLSGE